MVLALGWATLLAAIPGAIAAHGTPLIWANVAAAAGGALLLSLWLPEPVPRRRRAPTVVSASGALMVKRPRPRVRRRTLWRLLFTLPGWRVPSARSVFR